MSPHASSVSASAASAAAESAPPNLDGRQRRHLRLWFWSGAGLTFLVLIIGGITRLTQSGLSIVDWAPIMGIVPPIGDEQWRAAFARYQTFPEYQQLRVGMSLSEFRFIYFWEYLHRLMARAIGLVFLIPFAFFWFRGYLQRPWLRRALLLLGLGALQGVMGWFMVMSGLIDRPSVSHYRLAAHLSLAVSILGLCLWFAADLRQRVAAEVATSGHRRSLLRGLLLLAGLLSLQIVWGAFTAGLKAGHLYNTFPLMAGAWTPPSMWALAPSLVNLVENPVTVQWIHRALATLLLAGALLLFGREWRRAADPVSTRFGAATSAVVLLQYLLGVATLLLHVPTWLAVVHQALAMALVGVVLLWMHHAVHLPTRAASKPARDVPGTPAG